MTIPASFDLNNKTTIAVIVPADLNLKNETTLKASLEDEVTTLAELYNTTTTKPFGRISFRVQTGNRLPPPIDVVARIFIIPGVPAPEQPELEQTPETGTNV